MNLLCICYAFSIICNDFAMLLRWFCYDLRWFCFDLQWFCYDLVEFQPLPHPRTKGLNVLLGSSGSSPWQMIMDTISYSANNELWGLVVRVLEVPFDKGRVDSRCAFSDNFFFRLRCFDPGSIQEGPRGSQEPLTNYFCFKCVFL